MTACAAWARRIEKNEVLHEKEDGDCCVSIVYILYTVVQQRHGQCHNPHAARKFGTE